MAPIRSGSRRSVPDVDCIARLAGDWVRLRERGVEPILVSSGAIGFGLKTLGLTARPAEVEMRQACAAIGQPELVDCWRRAFGDYGVVVAQVLLSRIEFRQARIVFEFRQCD